MLSSRRATVHPRSRGEHPRSQGGAGTSNGSSPLARGTRPHPPQCLVERRFIPARAGNTLHCALRPRLHPVHPRSRGEHGSTHRVASSSTGSSPLARGTLAEPRVQQPERRFIPARAGNTTPPAPGASGGSVHPRSRGEHALRATLDSTVTGSSPLARGTRVDLELRELLLRFIPARAGNTIPTHGSFLARAVHPRSRGEHKLIRHTKAAAAGSSPLARGTHVHQEHARQRIRFIPARAGNTRR